VPSTFDSSADSLLDIHDTIIHFHDGIIEADDDVKQSETSRAGGPTWPGRPQQAELLCATLRPAPVGSLARTLRCDQSNVTRLVDRAAQRGLIRRRGDQPDGRVTLIELTPQGRKATEAFIDTLEAQLSTLLADWPEERRRAITATLNEIATALDEVRNDVVSSRNEVLTPSSTGGTPRR